MELLFTFEELVPFASPLSDLRPSQGVRGITTDSREDCSNQLFVPLVGEKFDGHDFIDMAVDHGAAALVVDVRHAAQAEKYSHLPIFLVGDTLEFYQNIARHHRSKLSNTQVIGVTGSSGKTSCKEILKTIFEHVYGEDHVYATVGNTNNHVGVPQNLLKLRETHRVAIIEMGTNHPGEISVLTWTARPDLVLISSIGASHLEFFGDTFGVAREKITIVNGLKDNGIAILPADSGHIEFLRQEAKPHHCFTFGESENADCQAEYLGGDLSGSHFKLIDHIDHAQHTIHWPLHGRHQAVNAAGCVLTARQMGLPFSEFIPALKNCSIPGMRMKIETIDEVTWINDAYNANPDSVKAGLNWLSQFVQPESTVLILGDMLELGEASLDAHAAIIKHAVALFDAATILLVGPMMARALSQNGLNRERIRQYSHAEALGKEIDEHLNGVSHVFLKGSRGMKLELVMENIRA